MIDKQELRNCVMAAIKEGLEPGDRWALNINPASILVILDELEACKADAERYRWLRDKAMATKETAPAILLVNDCCEPAVNGTGWQSAVYGKDADISVDAARAMEGKDG